MHSLNIGAASRIATPREPGMAVAGGTDSNIKVVGSNISANNKFVIRGHLSASQ